MLFRISLRTALAVLLLALALHPLASPEVAGDQPAPASKPLPTPEETLLDRWQVLTMAGKRVGYERLTVTRGVTPDGPRLFTDSEGVLALVRFGDTVRTRTISRSVETDAGKLLQFELEVHNPPAATTRSFGTVRGDKLLLSVQVGDRTTRVERAWNPAARGPGWAELSLRREPLKSGDQRKLEIFAPQLGTVDVMSLTAGEVVATKLLDGSERKLLQVSVRHSAIPGMINEEFMDASGHSLKSTLNLLNTVSYTVLRDEAVKEIGGAELDLAATTLVKPVPPLKNARKTRRVRYKISTPGSSPGDLFPAGDSQSVEIKARDVAVITVTALRPSSDANENRPAAEFLASNPYLQSDDPLIQKLAAEAAGMETDPWKTAVRLERWVSDNLTEKNFSVLLASAAEVAKTRSGDCTEHAVLLAALARARGIPSRAAVGLVYVPRLEAFGGHMWTEVWINGAWIPLDATLGEGGIAAEHLKMGDSSFADVGAAPVKEFLPLVTSLGSMRIEVLEAE